MGYVRDWFHRHFSDPQVVGLATVLVVGTGLVVFAGQMLAPVLASIIIAYLLEGLVGIMVRRRIPRFIAVLVVFSAFMTFVLVLIFGILPLISRQATQLIQELPTMLLRGQEALLTLPQRYPDLFSEAQVYDNQFRYHRRPVQEAVPDLIAHLQSMIAKQAQAPQHRLSLPLLDLRTPRSPGRRAHRISYHACKLFLALSG